MCGRTACTLAPNEVQRASRYQDRSGQQRQPQWRDGDADKYKPSYNKSPQSFSPVLLSNRHFNKKAAVDECVLATMRWGLVPAWFKESDPSKMQYSTTNCRSESLLEKKSYKDPLLRGQRCVILADGFYEWRRQQKDKQPFFIYFPQSQRDKQDVDEREMNSDEQGEADTGDAGECVEWTGWRLLTIAGLFESWTPPGSGEVLYTYTVITVNASPDLQSIHDRMPAILDGDEEVRQWLDFGEVRSLDALKLLKSKSCLTFHPVSSIVNNARNNSPECLQPLDTTKQAPQVSASSKMMMSWLKNSSPCKRKTPDDDGYKETEEKSPSGKKKTSKAAVGPLQQWLLGNAASKKPRT